MSYRFAESQIHLDLVELEYRNSAVTAKELEELVKSLKFENILQYVQIPRSLFSGSVKPSNRKLSESDDGCGRTEFGLVFGLLKEKGVTKIIKLIVDDDEETPHSDETIETLKSFDIEEWDWRKVDLCSKVIRKAARSAEVVFLYSSGNSAVLRSWSGADGLIKLREVSVIFLYSSRGEKVKLNNRFTKASRGSSLHSSTARGIRKNYKVR